VLEALWLVTAVAVPLAFNPWGYSAFELSKAVLLRALVLLMGLAALVQVIEGRRNGPHHPLLWPALAFGLALALATALSINPRASLWGSYERQQGLLTLSAYLALFLLTAANLRTRAQAERLWAALVWSSTPVVAYGLLQAVGLDPLDWRTDAASPVLSTVGRANFLGSYLVLVVPLTAGRALSARRRWPYGLLLAGQLACLALTQARGAWVGLGAAALTFGLVWAAATRNRRLALVTLALAVLAVGFVALLNLPGGPLAPLAHLPGLDRLATLTRTNAGSTAARLTIWRATLPLVIARPWLGYGPETMRPVFARVFPPQLVYYQGRHVTVDRAHNLWLDLGMSAGLAGIVAFGALLAGFGRMVWRGLRNVPDRWERVGGSGRGPPGRPPVRVRPDRQRDGLLAGAGAGNGARARTGLLHLSAPLLLCSSAPLSSPYPGDAGPCRPALPAPAAGRRRLLQVPTRHAAGGRAAGGGWRRGRRRSTCGHWSRSTAWGWSGDSCRTGTCLPPRPNWPPPTNSARMIRKSGRRGERCMPAGGRLNRPGTSRRRRPTGKRWDWLRTWRRITRHWDWCWRGKGGWKRG
jgi:O-antigen ligase